MEVIHIYIYKLETAQAKTVTPYQAETITQKLAHSSSRNTAAITNKELTYF